MKSLRHEQVRWKKEPLVPGNNQIIELSGEPIEIVLESQLNAQVAMFGLRLRTGKDEYTSIGFETNGEQIFVDRRFSGIADFHEGFMAVNKAKLSPNNDVLRLQVFVDTCSVEIFADDGRVVLSDLIFPSEKLCELELFVEGGMLMMTQLDLYTLKPVQIERS